MASSNPPPASVIIHAPDCLGIVDANIYDNGGVDYECRKCDRIWQSQERSEEELTDRDREMIRSGFEERRRILSQAGFE